MMVLWKGSLFLSRLLLFAMTWLYCSFHITGITGSLVPSSYGSGVPHASSCTCLWFLKVVHVKTPCCETKQLAGSNKQSRGRLDKLWQFPSNQCHKVAHEAISLQHICFLKWFTSFHMLILINIRNISKIPYQPTARFGFSTSSSLPSCCPKLGPIWPIVPQNTSTAPETGKTSVLQWKDEAKKVVTKEHLKRKTKNCLHFEPHHDFQVRKKILC